jgi:hypothetical protein
MVLSCKGKQSIMFSGILLAKHWSVVKAPPIAEA